MTDWATYTEQQQAEATGPVPWQCWEIPGFKDCNKEAGNKTNRYLKDQGITESNPLYAEYYPKFLRNYVYQCQIESGCTPSLLSELPQGTESQGSAWAQKLLLLGAGTFLAYVLYRKIK